MMRLVVSLMATITMMLIMMKRKHTVLRYLPPAHRSLRNAVNHNHRPLPHSFTYLTRCKYVAFRLQNVPAQWPDIYIHNDRGRRRSFERNSVIYMCMRVVMMHQNKCRVLIWPLIRWHILSNVLVGMLLFWHSAAFNSPFPFSIVWFYMSSVAETAYATFATAYAQVSHPPLSRLSL